MSTESPFAAIPDELTVWEMPSGQAVRLWLAAAYCWEVEDLELIPDSVWHALCKRLDAGFETLADPNGHHMLIDRAALGAGTAYYLRPQDFPPLARGLAQKLAKAWHGASIAYHVLPPGRWFDVVPLKW